MAAALSLSQKNLSPLFRQTVGFDRFNDLFETLASEAENKPSYPPYDIVKVAENDYQITMAVAGFNESDIDISLENETLSIAASHTAENKKDKEEKVYLHQGIARRSFSQKFRLAGHMKVKGADMVNGLLTIHISREIPEEHKPRTISINSKDNLN